METSHIKKVTLEIRGMHCASCEVLVEQKFKKAAGIKKVRVDHAAGKADLECSGEPNIAELNDMVKEYGYTVSVWERKNDGIRGSVSTNAPVDYLQMAYMFLVIVSLYYLLKRFDFLPSFFISERMSYGLIFLIGIFAAVSSCIAVVGGLL
ncbi:MAG: cation transporter, partial [Candidatus Paceibacterota bacterium]